MTNEFEKSLGLLPKVATEFFAYFSRFEFALKQAGFLEDASGTKKAKPNWEDFATDFSQEVETFFEDIMSTGHAEELIDKPPKVQMGDLSWKPWGNDPEKKLANSKELFCAVRRVRNNLFHGGKSSSLGSDPERDIALLKACLFILKEALKKCGEQTSGKLKIVCAEFNAPPNPPPSGLETS